jgi:hypothetical protein
MHSFIFRYLLIVLVLGSCQGSSHDENVLSKDFENAIKNNDTVLAKKIAQRKLDKTRASITDSSFAALIDASLELENLLFKIQKNDSSVTDNEYHKKIHSFITRVYSFALKRSIQKTDIDYYANKLKISRENWITEYFSNKTKKELKITLALLQQDVAIASGIINDADTKEGRKEIEESYSRSIKMIKEQE